MSSRVELTPEAAVALLEQHPRGYLLQCAACKARHDVRPGATAEGPRDFAGDFGLIECQSDGCRCPGWIVRAPKEEEFACLRRDFAKIPRPLLTGEGVPLDALDRALFIALLAYWRPGRYVWPSIATLAKTGMGERSVKRHLRALEEQGWIARVSRRRTAAGHASTWTWDLRPGLRKLDRILAEKDAET